MNHPLHTQDHIDGLKLDSPGWIFFVKTSFACALAGMLGGVVLMPVDLWMRGYIVMGTLFLVGSSFTLAKTMRDQFESSKMINRLSQARAEKLLEEYDSER
ncbi:MAG: YiaA/YiaB family inner membrane protein [Oceanococcus sp.]